MPAMPEPSGAPGLPPSRYPAPSHTPATGIEPAGPSPNRYPEPSHTPATGIEPAGHSPTRYPEPSHTPATGIESAGLNARPRVIGMIGGMSWESTAVYYRLANELVRERLGGLHSARIVLASVDFAEIEAMQVAGQWDEAASVLAEAARGLERAGADLLVLCTNTTHKVAPEIEAAVTIPFLHLADTTAYAVRAAGVRTVGLLGTAFTMEQTFYRNRLASHGLTVMVPSEEDRALVHRVIYEELCLGIVRDESRDAYRAIIDRLIAAGADGIILGCTEIELLIGDEDSSVPVFPTTRLHVEAVVTASLAP